MAIDIGTGDGRAVLARALAEPRILVIGLDAVAEAMNAASCRAARPVRRGGRPNILFVVAAAEALPLELAGLADDVTVTFPWGSLLRGIVAGDPSLVSGLAGMLKPGGRLTILLSVTERDQAALGLAGVAPGGDPVIRTVDAFVGAGLRAVACRPAVASDVAASNSSWGKRIRAGTSTRPAWLLRFERPGSDRCR